MSKDRKSPRITITLDEASLRQIQAIADEVGGSMSFVIRKAVKLYLRNRRDGGR
jgi:metal-responsive CopG/Arc/MetJ family transcriptional regulator